MIDLIHQKLSAQNLTSELKLLISYGALILGIALLAWLTDWIAKRLLLKAFFTFAHRTKSKWDDVAFKNRMFHRLAHLAPLVVIYLFAPALVFEQYPMTTGISLMVGRVSLVLMIFIIAMAIDALLNTIVEVFQNFEIAKQKPIKSYTQVAKIILFSLVAIFILSILLDKSPWGFLTGIGAISAVLLLVFKDSILGFVASVQLASYDMIRIGDWIEMPKFGADGDVIDISLNTIKVQNWDKTITTIPTASILTEPVKNWRGMSESGGRRIKRHLNIDMNSVTFCDEKMLQRFEKIQYISEYVQRQQQEVQKYNEEKKVDKSMLVNGRHLTNLSTFRAYIEAYLKNHPKIHQSMTLLVRQLQPGENGIPIEIYVFSNDQDWIRYEAIQSDIFDHMIAAVPEFELRVFQKPTGQDLKSSFKLFGR